MDGNKSVGVDVCKVLVVRDGFWLRLHTRGIPRFGGESRNACIGTKCQKICRVHQNDEFKTIILIRKVKMQLFLVAHEWRTPIAWIDERGIQ